jgi:threonine/homoserine/homoserine lactone efflux protein
VPQTSTIALFSLAALVLLLIPGPAVLYIVTRSVEQGRAAGLASVLGVEVGNFVHVLAATVGLSALLLSSALAFSIVKFLGAGYLIYLGVRTLLRREIGHAETKMTPRRFGHDFRRGVLVATLNPKTALFFFAFLPQFVDPNRGAVAVQILFLGSIFVAMGICTDSGYALLASTLRAWLRNTTRALQAQRYVAGSVYIALGLSAALTGSRRA